MKRKRISAVLGLMLAVVMLLGVAVPVTGGAAETITVLNPLGKIDPVFNQPLTARTWDDFSGKSIAFAFYAKALSPQSMRAIENILKSEYPTVTVTEYNLGSSIGAKPLDWYETLAQHDAVVLGIADCTLSAWWGAYHQKMIEARGTPTVMLTHGGFIETHKAGALDNGFTGARRAVVAPAIFSRGLTVLRNTNVDYLQTTYNAASSGYASVISQVKAALTGALTTDEANPPAVTAQQLAGWTSGDPTAPTLTVTGADEIKAELAFSDMAMELGFGDGLPLILPRPELVAEMLAATTRAPGEILGKVMPRGGIITVEKVAINSVMAGARPEYFPAILAAMEAYASSWEDANLLYHTLTSSDNYSLMLLFSGPIVEELKISGQWGFISSGNESSNAIGRSVRLSIRNIGLNRTHVTDGTARQGRQNDHALTVFGEELKLLPPGWERHCEMLGFNRSQSTVSLIGYYAQDMYFGLGGVNANFAPLDVATSGATKAGFANVSIMTIPRNISDLLTRGISRNSDGTINSTVISNKAQLLTYMGYSGGFEHMVFPVIVGDPESARVYTGGPSQYGQAAARFYGAQAFRTQLVTGATKTSSGRDRTAPAAPTNVTLSYNNGNAYLSWNAPAGAGAGLRYQVSYTGGAAGGMANPAGKLPSTGSPGVPYAPAVPISFNKPTQIANAYDVGQWPLADGTYDPALDGNDIIPGTLIFGLFDSSYNTIANPTAVTGYTRNNTSPASMQAGEWYLLVGGSGFNYVLIKTASTGPLPIVFEPAPLRGTPYDIFPSWIDVPGNATSVVVPGVSAGDKYYNDFWVRAVDDSVVNSVAVAEINGGTINMQVSLDSSASGRGAWAKAVAVTTTTHTVTFDNDGTITTATVNDGATVAKPADPSKAGFVFDGWYLGGAEFDFDTPITGDITLVAEWHALVVTYTVTFDNDGAVTTATVNDGATVAKPSPDPTKAGFVFDGWYLGAAKFNFDTPITGNITLTAKWLTLITSIKIDSVAVYSLARNQSLTVSIIVNPGAMTDQVVWSVSDATLATVTGNGASATITAKSKTGMVVVTARDTRTGLSANFTVRIT